MGLGEDAAVALVEAPGDVAGELDVGELVLAHGDAVGLAEQDVAGLVHGVGEEQAGEGVARGLLLGLDRGVAQELALAHEGEERQHELVERRHGRVAEDRGPLGVDAHGEVVEDHVVGVLGDMGRGVAVRDHLVVGDEDVGVDAHLLEPNALAHGAEVVAQVQAARGAVAREEGVGATVLSKGFPHGVGPPLRLGEALLVCHGSSFGCAPVAGRVCNPLILPGAGPGGGARPATAGPPPTARHNILCLTRGSRLWPAGRGEGPGAGCFALGQTCAPGSP